MTYRPNIPNQANLVRTPSGDLALMQGNFEALAPLVSGTVTSGTLPSAAIQGFYFGDDTNRKRYFLQSDGSEVFQLMRNIGSEGSPSWQAVLSFTQASGEDLTFAVKVSGVTPTDDAHLATKAYVDTVPTLSGLADTAISGPTSGQIPEWDGSDWANVDHVHAMNDLTDVSVAAPASGEVLIYDGAQWGADELKLSENLSDVAVSGVTSGQVLGYDGSGSWVPVNSAIVDIDDIQPLISGAVTSGTGASAALMGFYYGTPALRKAFYVGRLDSPADGLYLQRNNGSDESPSWESVFVMALQADSAPSFYEEVHGVLPTKWSHLVIRQYVDTEISGVALSGLSDTAVSGATSGQVLTSDGAGGWTADLLTLKRVICVLSGVQVQSIPQSTLTTFSGDEVPVNQGGFSVASGTITVPDAGCSRVDIQGEASWASSAVGTNYDLEIMVNGSSLSGLENYNLLARDRRRKSTTSDVCHQNVVAFDVPVVSGDIITMVLYQDGVGAGLDVVGGSGLIVRGQA